LQIVVSFGHNQALFVDTDVLEEHAACIFRVGGIGSMLMKKW